LSFRVACWRNCLAKLQVGQGSAPERVQTFGAVLRPDTRPDTRGVTREKFPDPCRHPSFVRSFDYRNGLWDNDLRRSHFAREANQAGYYQDGYSQASRCSNTGVFHESAGVSNQAVLVVGLIGKYGCDGL
jgi:hypothetical protein